MSYASPCHFLVEYVEGVVIVRPEDRSIASYIDGVIGDDLEVQDAVREVGIQLRNLVKFEGCEKLLLDFSNVRLISTALLGELIGLKKEFEEAGGHLKLCGLAAPLVREAFRITGLDRAFEIHSDAQVALDTPWPRAVARGSHSRPSFRGLARHVADNCGETDPQDVHQETQNDELHRSPGTDRVAIGFAIRIPSPGVGLSGPQHK